MLHHIPDTFSADIRQPFTTDLPTCAAHGKHEAHLKARYAFVGAKHL